MSSDLFSQFLAHPWAIAERDFRALRLRLAALLERNERQAFFELADFVTARPGLSFNERTGAATISIQGALADKTPPILQKLGQTDYRSIRAELATAIDEGASAIHLAIDSPGGSVSGLPETARAISAASVAGIPVHAQCDGMACSAAYWLASAADTITATPSSEVGNIGVVMSFADDTAFWEAQGIQFEVLTNEGADLKGTFRESLTDSQRDFLQADLNQIGADFHQQVTGNRDVSPEVFRAGWYSGQTALDLGLVDDIAESSTPTPSIESDV